MSPVLSELTGEYASALQAYLEGTEEPALVHAYELGRRALTSEVGLLDITAVHREALDAVLRRVPGNERALVERATGFLRETLAPFEMALRAFRDSNEALQRAVKAAEDARAEALQASQAKSRFLSQMSHELRTPLNAILGFGQLLQLPHSDEEKREYVGHVLASGRHLLDLINELLDISRIEAGSLTLSMEDLPLDEAVREAVATVRPMAEARGVTIGFDDDGLRPRVQADRQRLKQVLLNLLSNAIKYNVEGGRVTLASRKTGARVRLEVSDTGPGIPAAMRPRLFEPYERLGAEETAIEGTGLGLALTKGLIELMGGAIGVETEDGVGTTFWIDLAIADPSAPPPHPNPQVGEQVLDV